MCKGVQPLLPQGPVRVQPFIDLGEWLGTKTVNPPLRLLANLNQPDLAQDPQVSGYPWASNRQQRRQLTGGRRTTNQGLQQRSPALVRQRPQNGFHGMTVPLWLRNRQGT